MTKHNNDLSRRGLIAGVAAGGAALTLGSLVTNTRPATAADDWSQIADIVVVGCGAAGATAAIIAAQKGNSVIVLEKGDAPGGTTAKSGGVYWIPNHYGLRAQGIDDNKEDCLRFLCRYSFPERYAADAPNFGLEPQAYALLEAFYDNGAAMIDDLRSSGVLQAVPWIMSKGAEPAPDYFSHAPENKVSAGRPMGTSPDGSDFVAGADGGGPELMLQLEDALAAAGVPILLEHRVKLLITSDDGDVVGAEVSTSDGTVTIGARKGVIFATGGYMHNPEMVRLFQRNHFYGGCGAAGSTGDFVSIGAGAGARLGNMSGAWRAQVLVEETLERREIGACVFLPPGDSMIEVNKFGKRVVNEKRNYNDRTEVHFVYDPSEADYPNHLLFMIYDQRVAEAYGGNYPLPGNPTDSPFVISGATLPELTAALTARLKKIAARTGDVTLADNFTDTLRQTIARFNIYARTGDDPDFNRGGQDYDRAWHPFFAPQNDNPAWPPNPMPNNTMHPLAETGPYYAMILGAGALDTNGGPVINEKAEVLDAADQPIKGLYGAGNCVASPSREAYFGAGATIGQAMTFGYIAANNASARKKRSI